MTNEPDIDLGDGHTLRFLAWRPDRSIKENAEMFDGAPDCERFGATVGHKKPNGSPCQGVVTFDGDVQRAVSPKSAKWTVESWEPLTLSPSLLCSCGDHGFIRGGKWVRA